MRVGRSIWLSVAIACWLILGLAWSLASPPGSAPDDDFHLGSIWCAWGRDASQCTVTGLLPDRATVDVPALQDAFSNCVALNSGQSAACQFKDPASSVTANTGGYPQGFYAFLRLFATQHLGPSVIIMRMVVWTLTSGLWLAMALIIPIRSRLRLIVVCLTAMVPLGLFLSTSTNPSAALITGIPVSVLVAANGPSPSVRRGVAAMAICVTAALFAVFSRADAPFLLVLGLAAVLAWRIPQWRLWRHWVVYPALLLAITVLGFFVGGHQASALSSGLSPGQGGQPPSLRAVMLELPTYFVGTWSTTLGYVDVPMPPIVWAPIAVVLSFFAVSGLASWHWSKGLSVGGLVIAQIGALVYLQTNTACCTIQTRYFLPLTITWLALLALVPHRVRVWPLQTAQAVLVWAILSLAHALALRQLLARYTAGLGSEGDDPWLRDPEWWWSGPVSPLGVLLLGSLAFTVLLGWLLIGLVQGPRSGNRVRGDQATPPSMSSSMAASA